MKVAVIGGGAAGLACAAQLSRINDSVQITIFEQNDKAGKKLLATGNGRCNLTHKDIKSTDYISLSSDIPEYITGSEKEVLDFFEYLGVKTFHDEEGRYYPLSNQAVSVLDALRIFCENKKVNFEYGTDIKTIKKSGRSYTINGKLFDYVVVCGGGKSQVRQYDCDLMVKSIGHSFTDVYPMLVRLVTDSKLSKELKGVRSGCSMTLMINGKEVRTEDGEVQFGDYTVSGICSMQISPYVVLNPKCKKILKIDLIPSMTTEQIESEIYHRKRIFSESGTENLLSGLINKKIGIAILHSLGIKSGRKCGDIRTDEIRNLAWNIKSFEFNITGVRDFNDAQVMLGGIKLTEVNLDTLESKVNPGIYFAGEILDITGYCGGYNLNWAWLSALKAANSINRKYYAENK